jgi:serine/threonine protein kinase/tetratricopeptide (TPR) repeat protein
LVSERIAGRFEVREVAGRGASGVVHRARDLETGADVALKLIPAGAVNEHFTREAGILEGLRHPSIVAYIAHGTTDDGDLYLALEWLEGETLSQRLRRGPLLLGEVVGLVQSVAEALAYAHDRGVIHRDIKPSNVFLVPGGGVKVIDFGIARLRNGTTITRTGAMIGTPAYMAPEQARGDEIDGRADIFSLGCVFYGCLTGATPFGGENMTATLAKILFDSPPPLRARRRDVPVEIEALVERMLEKEAGARVPSMHALLDELSRAPRSELHATSIAPTESGPAVTMTERHFVSVVLARSRSDDLANVPREIALSADATEVDDAPTSTRSSATPRARIVRLVDGTIAATFGGSSAPDHVEQAAHLALMLRRSLPEARIVVTSGLAVVEHRLPIGDVIERAARMLDRTTGRLDGIHVDAISARFLDARFDIVQDGGEAVLLGERRSHALRRTLLGKPSPHVGRERELGALLALVEESFGETTPRCAVVTGAPGLGKSRLVSEVLARARERHPGLVTWFARGDRMSVGSSFALAAELVRDAVMARRGDTPALVGSLLSSLLARRGVDARDRDRISSTLASIATERAGDAELARDPRSYADRVFTAFEDFVRAVATNESPLVIVLDDLQWGDLATVRVIEAAVRNLPNAPFCVLAAARPDVAERFPNLWSEHGTVTIPVSDLSPRAARKLVTSILGDVDEAVLEHVVEHAAGNAFHLEELVRAVAEGRGDALPETVLAMVSARMQLLGPEARRLLRAASVFGETFWEQGALALVADASEAEWTACAERLAELVRQELVVVAQASQVAGDVEYHFRHSIVRDAAYAALTDADRVVSHRRAGEWLVAAGSTDARVLAEHFDRGGDLQRAATYYVRAAQQSLLAGDVTTVLELCARAHACDATNNAAELWRLEAEAHFWQGDFAGAESAAARGLHVRRVDDPMWWSCAAIAVVSCLWREGWERAVPIYETMHATPYDAAVAAHRLVASSRVAVHLCAAGHFAEADKLLASIRADVSRGDARGDVVIGAVRNAEGMRALCAGDLGAYHAAMTEAASLFERGGDERNACNVECNLGFCLAELGAYAEAETILRASVARARRLGLGGVEYSARHNLGYAVFRLGRFEEAREIERVCAEFYEDKGDGRTAGGSRLYLAIIALARGDVDEAQAEIGRALALLAETRPVRAYALAVLASVLLAGGEVGEACVVAGEAQTILSELGAMEQGEAFVRLAFVETRRAAGDLEAARRAASAARARLIERGESMSEALRTSFFTNVPENARTFAIAAELDVRTGGSGTSE